MARHGNDRTTWYQLQRYMSKYFQNNLAHIFLLFAQCASVSQICINLIGLEYVHFPTLSPTLFPLALLSL